MPTERKRPRVEGDRKGEVLDAALRMLIDVGYDRLTMDMVASEAKASKATLYRLWPRKAELVVDAVTRCKQMPDPQLPSTGSLRDDLLAMFCGPGGASQRLPMSVLGGLLTALHTDADLSAAWRERFLEPRMAVTRQIFAEAVQRGEIPADLDLDLLHTVLPSMCAFQTSVLGREVDAPFIRRVIDHVVLPATSPTALQETL